MSNTALYSFVSKPELQRNPKYFLDLSVLCFASLGGSESHLEHLQKVQENDVNLGISKNIVREQQAGYAVAATKQDHALVRELWAIDGQSDRFHVQRITERSGLPVKWLSAPPRINGERGIDKLMEDRNILLLRDRKSPFIKQFQHPLGRCAKFYKLTAYNNCNFWCEYCYLYLTFRTCPVSTHFVNYDRMFKDIEKFDRQSIPDALRVLNLGELSDPLAVDDVTGLSELKVQIALCKETPQVWKAAGLDGEGLCCNCMG